MKKIFFSLITAALMFTACGNDEIQDTREGATGDITAKISFEGVAKAAESTAVPKTSWANVKQVQLFLYDKTTGNIAFSYIFYPTADNQVQKWSNVPVGTYDLAIVANAKSSSDNVATTIDGGANWTEWTRGNVEKKVINDKVFIDLKPITAPAGHNLFTGKTACAEPAELFTAYVKDIKIEEGKTTDLTATPLALKRGVALFRVRINHKIPLAANAVFNDPSCMIAIQRMPVGFGLPTQTPDFKGGIFATASNKDKVLVAATGANTYKTVDPASIDYNPTTIIKDDFKLWRDVVVLPNATQAENIPADGKAKPNRAYHITLSAKAPAGYTLTNGKVLTAPTIVYWEGTVNEVFKENIIREVNITLTAGGKVEPEGPNSQGGLHIVVGAPENWNSNIERSDLEVQ